ncbi:hypothetical protein CDAR_312341 [Caerostris darwini]|uniref:Uncharacterized protein n=1 Tax=Caerostris darwini TaxID=1538125 RepID=A0AAV4QP09_9ARAC|nr:hypothetical protein CDAR_312341 [Caerostris darwini]
MKIIFVIFALSISLSLAFPIDKADSKATTVRTTDGKSDRTTDKHSSADKPHKVDHAKKSGSGEQHHHHHHNPTTRKTISNAIEETEFSKEDFERCTEMLSRGSILIPAAKATTLQTHTDHANDNHTHHATDNHTHHATDNHTHHATDNHTHHATDNHTHQLKTGEINVSSIEDARRRFIESTATESRYIPDAIQDF